MTDPMLSRLQRDITNAAVNRKYPAGRRSGESAS